MNIGMLIAGRVIGGIGNGSHPFPWDKCWLQANSSPKGLNTSIAPVYHAETSRAMSRGRAVIGELFILDVGWLIAQFVTLAFSFVGGGLQWVSHSILQDSQRP